MGKVLPYHPLKKVHDNEDSTLQKLLLFYRQEGAEAARLPPP